MEDVFIIAEAGVNHNGSLSIALNMIDAAAKVGADAIKFQTFKAEKMVSKSAPKALYQKQRTNNKQTQLEMLSKLELTYEEHLELLNHTNRRHIKFLSTPFDLESIELLNNLGLDTFKIPSGEITNLPYLQRIGRLNKNIILSTGMSTLDEIKIALDILISQGTSKKKITVLHATTEYPAPYEEVNLRAITTIKKKFGVKVGYSDHTAGIEVAVAAVVLGACVIEKHFTLDRNMEGPDHKASLEPNEFSQMVMAIRHIEMALGNGIKKPSPSELKNLYVVRKSIHYAANLNKGHFITEDDLIMKRPGNGISPIEIPKVLNKQLKFDVSEDTPFRWEDVE
jgi:N,N'-diacetyllegionaminate synthase